jgi:hypothetical protein
MFEANNIWFLLEFDGSVNRAGAETLGKLFKFITKKELLRLLDEKKSCM